MILNLKKTISKILFTLVLFLWVFSFFHVAYWQDILQTIFQPSHENDTVLNFWSTKKSVWSNLLRPSSTATVSSSGLDFYVKEPLLVRWAKFLLRITVALSVSMILYNSIVYIVNIWQWKDRLWTDAQKDLIYVWVWLLVALSSVAIIEILSSIAYTTATAWLVP